MADDDDDAAAGVVVDGDDDDRVVEGDMNGKHEAGCNDVAERWKRRHHLQVNIGVGGRVEGGCHEEGGRQWPVENDLSRYRHSSEVYPSWSSCPYSGWGQPGRLPVHEPTADRCYHRRCHRREDIDTIYDPYTLRRRRRRRLPTRPSRRGDDVGGIGERS